MTNVDEAVAIEDDVFTEDTVLSEEDTIDEGPAHEKEVVFVESVPNEELAPIQEPTSIEESTDIVTSMPIRQDANFTMPTYGPDEFRFDKSRWINDEPLDFAALQAAQEYTPPQTPMSMLSLGFAETSESGSPGLRSVEETKARTDALIAKFEWETRRRHDVISDVLAKYHGFYAGPFPHPLPQVVRPIPIAAPPIVSALRQIFAPHAVPYPPAKIPEEVELPPSPEPESLTLLNSSSSLSTPPPDEAVQPVDVSKSPAPPKLRKIAVFTASRATFKPRRV